MIFITISAGADGVREFFLCHVGGVVGFTYVGVLEIRAQGRDSCTYSSLVPRSAMISDSDAVSVGSAVKPVA